MHIWTIENWQQNIGGSSRREGLRFRYESDVHSEFRKACKCFAKWLRTEYYFPLRVPVYVKSARFIRAMDGEDVVGTFFEPFDYSVEPYIRIATGDYEELKNALGKEGAQMAIFATIAHELTHYFQWINGLELTDVGRERQAMRYARFIVDEYRDWLQCDKIQGKK